MSKVKFGLSDVHIGTYGLTTSGVKEVATLSITAAASAGGNITITLDNIAKTVAVLTGDIATAIGDKVRLASFPGWVVTGTGSSVTFTAANAGTKVDAVYSAGTTGATGTISTTAQGTDGLPMTPVPGAVELTYEPSIEQTPFYADNIAYYLITGQAEITGTLNMALFPDDFKKKYLGYKSTSTGALLQQVGLQDFKAFNISFKILKDDSEDVIVLYNVTGGAISETHKTVEGTPAPEAESMPITITGDTVTKTWKMIVPKTNTGYATALTTPETPTAVVV